MKFKIIIFISFFISNICNAQNLGLDKKSISLKDFVILKIEMFMDENISNIFLGGGVFSVAYQNMNYKVNIDDKDKINIFIDAVMDRNRYRSKKYYPKLRDCNQVRNKIFLNKYGYSFFRQKFNNLVSVESLEESLNEKVFNISSLDQKLKKQIIDNIDIRINVIHPKAEKNLSCGGKITDVELALK